jgi:hypothetical protein
MSETANQIHDIQKQTNADDDALAVARERRTAVLGAATTFTGISESYISGSLATGVVTGEVEDADGGAIADRRCYPALDPDGDNESPVDVVADMQAHVGPLVREDYPDAVVKTMKRGLRVFVNEPLSDGQDPYVDLVFAMKRRDKPGLWIPNMDTPRWDPADPQKHVELLNSGEQALRSLRAQTIRLAKVWNKQFSEPGLCSFNICAVGLEAITDVLPIEEALFTFFDHAASALAVRRTEDPAGVSGPITLQKPKDIVVKRLRDARDGLGEALEHDDDPDAVQSAMHRLFFQYVQEPAAIDSKNDLADRLRVSTPRLRPAPTGVVPVGTINTKRSYGGRRG